MGTQTVDANTVAKFFLWKASQEDKQITNKKIQKLLYYAQAWNLAIKDKPLYSDKIEAWIHGPTVRSVYDEYKRFGFNPIDIFINEKEIEPLKDNDLLNDVWNIYGKYDASYLETLTHSEQPWQIAREGLEYNESSSNVITLDSMREYYKNVLEAVRNDK